MLPQLAESPTAPPSSRAWLVSERVDFWGVAAGGGVLLLLMALVLAWHGERELAAADIILGELHLGATYGAIVGRGLWRRMPVELLLVPLAIVAATYALAWHDRAVLLTTIVLYLGAWHRGRQTLGIARHYQRRAGGPVSAPHRFLLQAAFYLPMIATVAYYTSIAPDHEGEPFHQLSVPPDILWALAMLAGASVLAYLALTLGRTALPRREHPEDLGAAEPVVHPGERWLVVANALGFGSAYVLGAGNSWFVLVLAIHHEVQYLFFTYALARSPGAEVRRVARFAVWPVLGLGSWALCTMTGVGGLEPFLTAGLLGHYWLDGRIWNARARRMSSV
jgi:hypothetical protein